MEFNADMMNIITKVIRV